MRPYPVAGFNAVAGITALADVTICCWRHYSRLRVSTVAGAAVVFFFSLTTVADDPFLLPFNCYCMTGFHEIAVVPAAAEIPAVVAVTVVASPIAVLASLLLMASLLLDTT